MNIIYEQCAGIDVHKKNVVVCAITPNNQSQRCKEMRMFSALVPAPLQMQQWFESPVQKD